MPPAPSVACVVRNLQASRGRLTATVKNPAICIADVETVRRAHGCGYRARTKAYSVVAGALADSAGADHRASTAVGGLAAIGVGARIRDTAGWRRTACAELRSRFLDAEPIVSARAAAAAVGVTSIAVCLAGPSRGIRDDSERENRADDKSKYTSHGLRHRKPPAFCAPIGAAPVQRLYVGIAASAGCVSRSRKYSLLHRHSGRVAVPPRRVNSRNQPARWPARGVHASFRRATDCASPFRSCSGSRAVLPDRFQSDFMNWIRSASSFADKLSLRSLL